jgi:hypothetical protein
MKRKILKVTEIRKELHKLQMELIKCTGANKLTNTYLTKVQYMLMWMRLIPIDKRTLKGWSMPDCRTISDFKKAEEKKKEMGK